MFAVSQGPSPQVWRVCMSTFSTVNHTASSRLRTRETRRIGTPTRIAADRSYRAYLHSIDHAPQSQAPARVALGGIMAASFNSSLLPRNYPLPLTFHYFSGY